MRELESFKRIIDAKEQKLIDKAREEIENTMYRCRKMVKDNYELKFIRRSVSSLYGQLEAYSTVAIFMGLEKLDSVVNDMKREILPYKMGEKLQNKLQQRVGE